MKRILIIIISIFILLLTGLAVYIFVLLEQIPSSDVNDVAMIDDPQIVKSEEPQNIPPEKTAPAEVKQEDIGMPTSPNVTNVLLLGLDENKNGNRGRTDTIMIASMNRDQGELKLTSLMRDLYLPIPGQRDNRINAAYVFGGTSLIMQTINENFDLDLEEYVIIDLQSFERIVDSIGGISIDISPEEFRVLQANLQIEGYGVQTLNGRQALAYARIRNLGRGDFDRVDRQQIVITKVFERLSTISFLRLPGILSTILPYLNTNLSALEIVSLGTSILALENKEIQRFRLPVENTYNPTIIREMMVLLPDITENTRLLHEFIYEE